MIDVRNNTPADLAHALCTELVRRGANCDSEESLVEIFQTLFFASLRTEEGRSINCYIVYLDPANPDPHPPRRITQDRWSYVKFDSPIPLNIGNLVKVAKATDPRSSSLAVYSQPDRGSYIWGLVDQGASYYEFAHYDSQRGSVRPGLFQACITDVGHITAYIGYEIVAELKANRLVTDSLDVLRYGPIRKKLEPGIDAYVSAVRTAVAPSAYDSSPYLTQSLKDAWTSSICRVLKRMRGYKHGGAFLITPSSTTEGLNVKHSLSYNRLDSSLQRLGKFSVGYRFAWTRIRSEYLNRDADHIPADLYLEERFSERDREEAQNELDGCIWFVSLLSCVDGLVLLTPDLVVRGFGVEITVDEEPPEVFISSTASFKSATARSFGYQQLGTRHRSMMRYCHADPKAVGFVVSQDGAIRAITRVGRRIVMWENIKIDQFEYVSFGAGGDAR